MEIAWNSCLERTLYMGVMRTAHKLANTDVKGYYIHMNKKSTSMIIRSYALDKQLLELLVNNAKSNERNISSELRFRLRQAYGLIPSQEAAQA